MEPEQIIIEPLLTEKGVAGRAGGRYAFKVNLRATKVAVKQAIEKCFKVKVLDVNTLYVRPKRRVAGRFIGKTSGWKKAYVTLRSGQKIQELET